MLSLRIILMILLVTLPGPTPAQGEMVVVPPGPGHGFAWADPATLAEAQSPGAMGRIGDYLVLTPSGGATGTSQDWPPKVQTPVTEDLPTFLNNLQPGQILLTSWGTPRLYGFFSHSLLVLEGGLLLDVRNNPFWGQGVIIHNPSEILDKIIEKYGRLTALEMTSAGAELQTRVARTALESLGLPFQILVPRMADWAHYCSQFIWLRYYLASQGEIDLAPQDTYFVTPDQIYYSPHTTPIANWLRDGRKDPIMEVRPELE